MHLIKYRSRAAKGGGVECLCNNCKPGADDARTGEPTRLANMSAFVRLELTDDRLALSTSLNFESANTLFMYVKPGCEVVGAINLTPPPPSPPPTV